MFLFFYIIYLNCAEVLLNYTFYEVVAFNTHERYLLHKIYEAVDNTYFLNEITNEAATLMDVVVDSCCTQDFEQLLLKYGIEYSCVKSKMQLPTNYSETNKDVSGTFLSWEDIMLWIDNKLNEHSALTKTVIAKTYEHRDIFVLKISSEKISKKMAVFIVSGEEGRDWLSSALLLNYINRILESATSSNSLLHFYDMYFVPIFNPDGFVYTKQKDRMWAKNRKILQPTKSCEENIAAVGVNIDKNWFDDNSASKYACNATYAGSQALSEEETQALSYILNSIALKLLTFINLRGFGNLITLPFSEEKEVSTNHNIVMEIMKHVSAVLKLQFNKSYPVGTSGNYFYNFYGSMPDWVKKNLNIPIVFTVYMQHEKFLPEASHIVPLTEQFESLLNITLVISKEIYGSLYNTQIINASSFILILINFIYVCNVRFLCTE